MKIAVITCVWPPYKGGIGASAKAISLSLAKSGHQITVFTPDYGRSKEEYTKELKVCRMRPFLKYGNAAFLPQLFFKLKSFDLIYLHYPFFGTSEIAALAVLYFKKKFIVHYHMDVQAFNPFTRLMSLPSEIIKPFIFKRANLIISASLDYIKQSGIKKIYKKFPEKFLEIPFGVDIEKFCPEPNRKNEGKKILFVGGLDKAHYFKGVNVLLKAVASLKNENWILQIVGDGNLKNDYVKQAQELGISDKVRFMGKCENNLPEVYRNSDLFVLPSINKNEAFGIVLLEAISSGIPVIASELSGVRKVFESGKQGLLAKPGDSEDLKNKIEQILNNSQTRIKMGIEARKLAVKKYDNKIIKKKIIESIVNR